MKTITTAYHVYKFIGYTDNGGEMYSVGLNFTPRPAGQAFSNMMNGEGNTDEVQQPPSVKKLSAEEKAALKARLHNGQGDLTLQEWDDFLADLVDLGLITNDQRHFSTGLLRRGPVNNEELDQMWTGDPVKWLNNLDMHYLKNELYSNMGLRIHVGISDVRKDIQSISELIKELLN